LNCLLALLKRSATPGTTDPLAPFGIVTLASSGSEGGPNMGAMRWAQTGSYGVLPSPELPNTFLAQAYDLDDEWGPDAGPCFDHTWACCPKGYNATKCAGRETLCQPACFNSSSYQPVAMSGIHPRSKLQVGQRLARAAYNLVYGGTRAFTGPTLAGCTASGSTLTINFNTTLLRGERLALQSIINAGGSQLFVQTNATLFCMESQCVTNASSGGCVTPPPHQATPYVCPVYAGGDGVTQLPGKEFGSGWVQLNFTAAPSGTAILVDLSPLNGTVPTAVQYAWGLPSCCDNRHDPDLYVTHGCIANCPIMSSSGLPANPFQARIVAGKCQCVAPQVCDGE
jgi:hypothetical protein